VVTPAAALAVVVVALTTTAATAASLAAATAPPGLCTKALCTAPVAVVVAHFLRMAAVWRTTARTGRVDIAQVQELQTPVTVAVVDTDTIHLVAMVVRAL
jgi:hypothetical protein